MKLRTGKYTASVVLTTVLALGVIEPGVGAAPALKACSLAGRQTVNTSNAYESTIDKQTYCEVSH